MPRSPLVVKNGSMHRRRASASMPTPVSPTSIRTQPGSSASAVRSVSVPPSGMASSALKIRLVSASRISLSMPITDGMSCDRSVSTFTTAPFCSAMFAQRARVRSRTWRLSSLSCHRRAMQLLLALAIEFAHPADGMADVLHGPADDFQLAARGVAETLLGLQHRLGIEGDGRQGVVDVVGDAAGHLAQGAQPILLHHRLLRLAQVVIGALQGAVELGLMGRQRHVLAELQQELVVGAAEGVGVHSGGDEAAEHLVLELQRRGDERLQAGQVELRLERQVDDRDVRFIDQLALHAEMQAVLLGREDHGFGDRQRQAQLAGMGAHLRDLQRLRSLVELADAGEVHRQLLFHAAHGHLIDAVHVLAIADRTGDLVQEAEPRQLGPSPWRRPRGGPRTRGPGSHG